MTGALRQKILESFSPFLMVRQGARIKPVEICISETVTVVCFELEGLSVQLFTSRLTGNAQKQSNWKDSL